MTMSLEQAGVTPVFYTAIVEDKKASAKAGRPIMVEQERVEYRFAGDRNFNPHFLAHEFHEMKNHEVITHAMRFPKEYQKFKETGGNEARGTPLQNLPGLTQIQLSTLKSLEVRSIEALASLEGRPLKNLGPGGHALKAQAQKYLSVGSGVTGLDTVLSEIAALKAQNEELSRIVAETRSSNEAAPETEAAGDEDDVLAAYDDVEAADPYAGIDDAALKDRIEQLAGSRPRGNPSRETLIGMLSDLEQGEAA